MKYLTFLLENGDLYGLPLQLVAFNRAEYYRDNDKDTTYTEEYEYTMTDSYEAIDWFKNSTDAEYFDGHYTLLKKAEEMDLFDRLRNSESIRIQDFEGS